MICLSTQTINEKLQTLYEIGQILLDLNVEDKTAQTTAFEHISQVKLKAAMGETKQLIRPKNDAYVDYFGKSYKRVQHFSSRFLATLQFHTHVDDQGLLKALQLVREIHAGNHRKLPDDAPTAFIPDAWLP